jgi:phosphohistidine phosphatase
MKLVLFRHGIALDREEAIKKNIDDALRPLTEEGIKKTQKMAEYLVDQVDDVDMIVTSPLKRAKQTADIIAKTYKTKNLLTSPELSPQSPPHAFAQWLKQHADEAGCVIAVGHEPQMSSFATWALSSLTESFIKLKKSGVICLDFETLDHVEAKSADLLWMISPKLI